MLSKPAWSCTADPSSEQRLLWARRGRQRALWSANVLTDIGALPSDRCGTLKEIKRRRFPAQADLSQQQMKTRVRRARRPLASV